MSSLVMKACLVLVSLLVGCSSATAPSAPTEAPVADVSQTAAADDDSNSPPEAGCMRGRGRAGFPTGHDFIEYDVTLVQSGTADKASRVVELLHDGSAYARIEISSAGGYERASVTFASQERDVTYQGVAHGSGRSWTISAAGEDGAHVAITAFANEDGGTSVVIMGDGPKQVDTVSPVRDSSCR